MQTMRRPAAAARVAVALQMLIIGSASGEDHGRFTVIEENDSILHGEDRYYTQGLQLNYLSPDIAAESQWSKPFDLLSGVGLFDDGNRRSRHYEILLGQTLFTPSDISDSNPDADDRPYAGWTYGGVGLVQDTDRRRLDHLELQIGVVGPSALGRQTQNDYHQFIGVDQAKGWDHQLHDEPGLMLSYERKWRFLQPLMDDLEIDAIPEVGATLGNVMTYAETGAMFRFGRNLEADYGPARIRPALSGTSYFNARDLEDPFGFYLFLSGQGRAVARNIFLDGNSFEGSRSVDSNILVADLSAGASLFWRNSIKLDLVSIYRTKEFDGQSKSSEFAGINLTLGF